MRLAAIAATLIDREERAMAKGQKRSNREKKKPKQDKKKVVQAASPMVSLDQRGKSGRGGVPKKGS